MRSNAPYRTARDEYARLLKLAQAGEEHAELKTLVGSWKVTMTMGDRDLGFAGTAEAETILGDRFFVVDGKGMIAKRESAFRYTIGFDRRHDEYVIIVFDTSGTYPVTARGKKSDGTIRMFGTDDDPNMKKMGFEKKFALDLTIKNKDDFSITTIFIDTRTKDEKLQPAFTYHFTRADLNTEQD